MGVLLSLHFTTLFSLELLSRWHFGMHYFQERDPDCHSIHWKGHLITYFIASPVKTRRKRCFILPFKLERLASLHGRVFFLLERGLPWCFFMHCPLKRRALMSRYQQRGHCIIAFLFNPHQKKAKMHWGRHFITVSTEMAQVAFYYSLFPFVSLSLY